MKNPFAGEKELDIISFGATEGGDMRVRARDNTRVYNIIILERDVARMYDWLKMRKDIKAYREEMK